VKGWGSTQTHDSGRKSLRLVEDNLFCQIELSGYNPTISTKEAYSIWNIRQCTKLKDQVILKEMVVRVVMRIVCVLCYWI